MHRPADAVLANSPDPRVLELWRRLVHVPDAFEQPGVTLVSDDRARVAPPGWCGVIAIGGSAVVTTPTACPPSIENLLGAGLDPEELTDAGRVAALIGPLHATLGPADLQYGIDRLPEGKTTSGPLSFDDPLVQRALASIGADDRSEAGFDEPMEATFVAVRRGTPVALAGYRRWEGLAAHIGVATAPQSRRQGHGHESAAAAINHAIDQGLVVQWRSHRNNQASRLLGRGMGLVHCARQLSFQVPGD